MHRTTVLLPTALKNQALRLAHEMGISLGELIRSSIELRCTKQLAKEDPFFTDKHIHSGKTSNDVARNHDDYLY